jgi:hypothetical protein
MLKFIEKVKTITSFNEYTLLTLDGHTSRLNATTMLSAACNQIICFVGPSNLTNAWQANDSGVNRQFKLNISKEIAYQIEAKRPFSTSNITIAITKAVNNENMMKTIQNSFRHVGLYPFDREKIQQMIRNEAPNPKFIETNISVALAVSLTYEKLDQLENLCGEKRKQDEEEKLKKKRRKQIVDTSFATLLTSPEIITSLQIQQTLVSLKKLKANELCLKMIEIGFQNDEMRRPNSAKWKTMKELLTLVEEKLQTNRLEHEKKITNEIASRLVVPASLFPINASQTSVTQ